MQAACPVAIFANDIVRLRRFAAMLVEESAGDGIEFWQVWGQCFTAVLTIREGDLSTGLMRLGEALSKLRNIGYGVYYIAFLAEYSLALSEVGEFRRACSCLEEALARSEQNEEGWLAPELWRLSGEFADLGGGPDAASEAEQRLMTALKIAREQEALFWEIKSAISLARFWRKRDRTREAESLLLPLIDRLTNGLDQPLSSGAVELLNTLRLLANPAPVPK